MSPRPSRRLTDPAPRQVVRDIANDLGVSSQGRFHSYENLLDWAVKQYWANRPAVIAERGAA